MRWEKTFKSGRRTQFPQVCFPPFHKMGERMGATSVGIVRAQLNAEHTAYEPDRLYTRT